MNNAFRLSKSFLPLLIILIFMGGCSLAVLQAASENIFVREDVNLAKKSHAAADLLISQAHTHLNRVTPIAVAPLSELLQPEISSAFGAVVSEQAGVRLSQLGYNVQLENVSAYADLEAPRPEKPKVLLTGTYNPTSSNISVSLRMVNLETRRIIGSFDYKLPMTRELEELSRPQPRVFKLSQ